MSVELVPDLENTHGSNMMTSPINIFSGGIVGVILNYIP